MSEVYWLVVRVHSNISTKQSNL